MSCYSLGEGGGGAGEARPSAWDDDARSIFLEKDRSLSSLRPLRSRSSLNEDSRSNSFEGERLMGSAGCGSSSIVSMTPSWELGRRLPPLGSANMSLLDRTTTCGGKGERGAQREQMLQKTTRQRLALPRPYRIKAV